MHNIYKHFEKAAFFQPCSTKRELRRVEREGRGGGGGSNALPNTPNKRACQSARQPIHLCGAETGPLAGEHLGGRADVYFMTVLTSMA